MKNDELELVIAAQNNAIKHNNVKAKISYT